MLRTSIELGPVHAIKFRIAHVRDVSRVVIQIIFNFFLDLCQILLLCIFDIFCMERFGSINAKIYLLAKNFVMKDPL